MRYETLSGQVAIAGRVAAQNMCDFMALHSNGFVESQDWYTGITLLPTQHKILLWRHNGNG